MQLNLKQFFLLRPLCCAQTLGLIFGCVFYVAVRSHDALQPEFFVCHPVTVVVCAQHSVPRIGVRRGGMAGEPARRARVSATGAVRWHDGG